MIATRETFRFSPQEYLEWEDRQELRYEYFDGEVFAMTGGSLAHADIALNFASILREHLRGRCKVRNSDAKIGITEDGPFTYPDVSVSCDERDRTATKFSMHPCLVIEILSPRTEAYDRGGKFQLYRRLESLREYVLVGSESMTVEVFQLNALGVWEFFPYGPGDEVLLNSIDLSVAIDRIYEDVLLVAAAGNSNEGHEE
jgi:Uma2 family endonuclease